MWSLWRVQFPDKQLVDGRVRRPVKAEDFSRRRRRQHTTGSEESALLSVVRGVEEGRGFCWPGGSVGQSRLERPRLRLRLS